MDLSQVAETSTSPARSDTKKVLVINDSPSFLELMREILEVEGGYAVATLDRSQAQVIAEDGSAPDMIILDIAFPDGGSGLDVAERLASAAETAQIPILFCTALREQDIDQQARELAAARDQRILYKPFDVDDLLQHVAELLDQRTSIGTTPARSPAPSA